MVRGPRDRQLYGLTSQGTICLEGWLPGWDCSWLCVAGVWLAAVMPASRCRHVSAGGAPHVRAYSRCCLGGRQDEFQVRFWKLRQGGYADYLTAYSGLQIRQARQTAATAQHGVCSFCTAWHVAGCAGGVLLACRITDPNLASSLAAHPVGPAAQMVPASLLHNLGRAWSASPSRGEQRVCCRATWLTLCTSTSSRTPSLQRSLRQWRRAARSLRRASWPVNEHFHQASWTSCRQRVPVLCLQDPHVEHAAR
jgi:hypothetical protein